MRITKWFVMSAVVVVGLAAWQWFGAPDSTVLRFDPVREVWIPRVSSVLAHPSVFGHYLVAVAGLAATAGIVLTGRHRWWLLGFIGLMAPLFLTYSRAVWLGMAAALAAMTFVLAIQWLQQRGARTALIGTTSIIVASIVLFIGSLAFTPAGTFLRSAIDPTYASNEERLEFMVRLLAPLSNTEALIGKGLGDVLTQNFREVSVSSYDIASGASRNVQLAKDRTLVDNQHLKTFVELGLAGLLVYAWLYWRLARTSFASAISRDTTQRILGVWSFGFLAAFVLQGFFIDIWDIYPTNVTFWIIAGLTSRYSLSTT